MKVSIDDLDADHRSPFNLILNSTLSTTLAERTFAQIIDGIPVRDDVGFFPTYSSEMAKNTASSPAAFEAARELREELGSYTSMIDTKVSPQEFSLSLKMHRATSSGDTDHCIVSASLPRHISRNTRILPAIIRSIICCLS